MSDSLDKQYLTSPLFGANAPFVEALYERFLEDPDSVDGHWRDYFRGFRAGGASGGDGRGEVPRMPVEAEFRRRAQMPHQAAGAAVGGTPDLAGRSAAAMRLIQAYRGRGHMCANLDPLGLKLRPEIPDLTLDFHGLTAADADTVFAGVSLPGEDAMQLKAIVAALKDIYCGPIGFEYMHISDAEQREWLRERIERPHARAALDTEGRRKVLQELVAAEGIEKYLHSRYVGQKRFSLEGGESLIPMLDDLIERSGEAGVKEIVIGMAHRGRINVLINVLGKSPRDLFDEFEGKYDPKVTDRSGDVKYHLGFASDIETPGGKVHVALAFNPSHLEIVDPVVEGSVRARQDRRESNGIGRVLPVLIHGDAAFAAQGVVMETLQMSETRGFGTGGTVHIVCNNQIGFTISDLADARSTPYCTDIAKMLDAPIFHVNGDHPEAALFVTRLALEYRNVFHKDAFVDFICYRRHGHNEADEPAATQPRMYDAIKSHPSVTSLYAERLHKGGMVGEDEAREMEDRYRATLDEGKPVAPGVIDNGGSDYAVDWSRYNKGQWNDRVDTALPAERARKLADAMNFIPERFKLQNRVQKLYDDRRKMAAGEMPLDWGYAETLAYASLLTDGYPVRLTGQDSARGTFFHRHAVVHNQADGETWIPLKHIADDQARFTVIDSLLSEEAVVGFEYGYSSAEPDMLTIWEAQFGDFANGAQVVIDQFISSGEAKWGRMCGLTLFLPHGYEGQGPEHSSARLERYLQLCAENNMQVCVPTTPAQWFHMLRRQMVRPYRKPLIVLTPKSLLRHKLSNSALDDIHGGHFHPVIPEIDSLDADKVRRVVFCSGKVYFDLLQARRDAKIDDIAVARIEQLYPFPQDEYEAIIKTYRNAKDIVWCQEEPENQGAWYQIRHRLQAPLTTRHTLTYAGRRDSASTAAGYFGLHKQQQQKLIEAALEIGGSKQKRKSVA
ncbi:MAG TPA: 2-oxoglutarate dehydrogenase E1 component [Gammaproteobacteria bacterium]|nr:2-oxoglutarate dehydrogenase E1 component [Gammaproteobacteria bacterium]